MMPRLSEANPDSLTTSHINVKISDDLHKDRLSVDDNMQAETNSDESSPENEETPGFSDDQLKLNSSNELVDRSLIERPSTDATRDILTRRHALGLTEKHNLKAYVRHRRNSIVEHVIGYNYDDNSIVGGLYTRVGIGSMIN